MGAEFNKIDNELIMVDEQTKIDEIKGINKEAFYALKKFMKDMKGEQVAYFTKKEIANLTSSSNFENLEKRNQDTYEFFQGTQLETNLKNTENLQNVAKMIDDFSENILFTGDKPIIQREDLNIFQKKNIITGLSLKISELVGKNKDIGEEIKKISNGDLWTITGTAISKYFDKTFNENIEQYRTNLEGLNKVPSRYFKKPEDVKSVIDQLMKNNGEFDETKFESAKIEDIKKIGKLLGTNLVNGEMANKISFAANFNNDKSNLSGEQKMKLFFNTSMGKNIKEFFNESPFLKGIISFLLSTFMGINLDKLMGNDELTKDKIPDFRTRVVTELNNIENADKLFSTSDGKPDLSISSRLYGIKDLLKFPEDEDLLDVFLEVIKKKEFKKISANLTGAVIDNKAITDNMDETINLYYDFLIQQSSENPLSIEQFIESKKKEKQAELPPTTEKEKKKVKQEWDKKINEKPHKVGDNIIAVSVIGEGEKQHKYETKISKTGYITITNDLNQLIKFKPENPDIVDLLQKEWNNKTLIDSIEQDQIIKMLKSIGILGNGKLNENTKKIEILSYNFTKVEPQALAGAAAGAAATQIPKANTPPNDTSTTVETKSESPKETKQPEITKKSTEKIMEEEAVEKMSLSEMNKIVPEISKDIDIQKDYFILKYDEKYTIKVNKDSSIYVKIKGKNNKYNLLEFKNPNSKDLVNKIYAGSLIYALSLEKKVINPLKEALKPIISKINQKSIDLGKSENGKEDYGKLILQKKYSTEIKTIEEDKKDLEEDKKQDKVKEEKAKKENPEKVKEKKKELEKNKIAYENEKDGLTFIRYRDIVGNKMFGKLGNKTFSIELKKQSEGNPIILIELGGEKFKSEIIKEKDAWSWNNVLYKVSSAEYNLKFNGNSEIKIDSDADIIGNISGGDFTIDPENLIREINLNKTNKVLQWDKSPTPGTKMVFRKYT